MKRKIVGGIIILFSVSIYLLRLKPKLDPIVEWQKYEVLVRDGKIDKLVAKQKLVEIKSLIDKYCRNKNFKKTYSNIWTFPVENYDSKSIGGKDGNGFKPNIIYGPYGVKGYDFFDGNKHGGHPAYDIFIIDKNQDCLDDRTLLPVNILSMKDCIVLSVNTNWQKGSQLRGGNYIWTYDPQEEMFLYYAHLDKIFVHPGQIVKSGEKIATVGRTGLLADNKKSPTHVHIMVLKYRGGILEPYDFYNNIVQRVKK